jgi:lipopolysaccharide/colanic/teichoic acid biosynthesis glycosyltransferase
MELAILPNISAPALEKTFIKPATVETAASISVDSVPPKEFFYLGKKTLKIDRMITLFEGGYAAETVDNAISILSRIIAKGGNLPGVFIADGSNNLAAINKLANFISVHEVLANVPLVLESSDIDAEQMTQYKNCKFIDDIISIDDVAEKFTQRVVFLRKIKNKKHHASFQKSIQTKTPKKIDYNFILKRSLDISVAATSLVLLSPIFLLISIAIKLESRGPVFYISKRAGRGYKIFNFYKFRTMEMNADKKVNDLKNLNQYNVSDTGGPVFFKVSNDPRISKFGSFLRNSSLDELPQLINVLIGDMSLVGNRPLPLYEAATLTTDEWAPRFLAPAGMTGLWQIKKRGHGDMSAEERISLDICYADKHNFMYDLWIMANTPTAVFQKSNV